MIKHVVCFKLKEYSLENMEKAREVILSMNEKVKEIKQLEVRYQKDEDHCNVVKKYLGEVTINTIAIDYYI